MLVPAASVVAVLGTHTLSHDVADRVGGVSFGFVIIFDSRRIEKPTMRLFRKTTTTFSLDAGRQRKICAKKSEVNQTNNTTSKK
jgi:hypothetical protein